jgi:hypothetical protein
MSGAFLETTCSDEHDASPSLCLRLCDPSIVAHEEGGSHSDSCEKTKKSVVQPDQVPRREHVGG